MSSPDPAAWAGDAELAGLRVAVIGAGAIGAAIATGFHDRGARVAVTNRSAQRAAQTAAQIASRSARRGEVYHLAADVTRAESLDQAFDAIGDHLGGLDVCVLAFGANARGPAVELADDELDRIVDVNLKGVFRAARSAHRLMLGNDWGRVIVIGSAAGTGARPWPQTAAYGASKAGASHLVRFLAAEWALSGITVNCLAPGYVRTELTEALVADPATLQRVLALTPMDRLGTLAEIVAPALFLGSPQSSFITGQTIGVDGGRTIY